MVTSMYESRYIAPVLAAKQWIWLTKAISKLNMLVTSTAMFWDNDVYIKIAYNHKIGDRSKHINVAKHLVCEIVTSR
jgi:hypothetical protein